MKRRVRIISPPKAQSGLEVRMENLRAGLGLNSNQMPWPVMAGKLSEPGIEVNSTLKPVPREEANLEAEEGEVAMLPSKGGVPSTFKIGGQRHSNGGTPLNLPPDSFIYSDTKDMRIKDPAILAQFGLPAGTYTPAQIAKKYDVNKFKKILADKNTDKIQRQTAEGMISNYNMKLAKLALLQESMKGFPQGIPSVAVPYMESMQIQPQQFLEESAPEGQAPTVDDEDQMKFGGIIARLKQAKRGGYQADYFQRGGNNIVTQQKKSDRVIFNPTTGQYEVYNALGKKVGIMNVPTNVNPNVAPNTTPQNTSSGVTTTVKKESIPSGSLVIKRSDYKTDEEYNKAKRAAYDNNPGKPVYIQNADGKYMKLTTSGDASNVMDTDTQLKTITTAFSDPAAQQALYDHTLKAVKDPKNRGKNMGYTVKEIESMTPAELTQHFVDMQYRNILGYKKLTEAGISYDCYNQNTGKLENTEGCKDSPYGSLKEAFQAVGLDLPDNTGAAIAQASYIGYRDLLDSRDAGKIEDPALNEILSPFAVGQRGVQDEEYGIDDKNDISLIDGYYTNTTSGQLASVKAPNDLIEEEISYEETPGPTKAEHLKPTPPAPPAAWWLQDIIKTAHAAGNLARIKKYMPWQATPDVVLPEMTFYDPTRELASNAEQANIAATALAQFTGPQAFNSRYNQVQGQAAKNAADIMARYNNQNVTVSNQQAAQNASIMNQAAQQRAALATNLFDKYQIANQQFDNAKSEARNALTQQYVNAITNKNYTANLNKMFPQFSVDPSIGGEYVFDNPRELVPDSSQAPDFTTIFNQVLAENPTLKSDPNLAANITFKLMGETPIEDPYTQYERARANNSQVPGYPGSE